MSKTDTASVMVRRLSHAKFPLSISQPCVTIMQAAASPVAGCGANSPHGTAHASMLAHTGAESNSPVTSVAAMTAPVHATAAKNRSE